MNDEDKEADRIIIEPLAKDKVVSKVAEDRRGILPSHANLVSDS